jgi:2-oxoglutarate ferredoxin oxidoreductase subunit alpha
MAGYSAMGKIPLTATSFPGFALMIESINMAYMMELPMVIVLAQRLGPATGSATCGAQGDLLLVHGTNSGGFQIPTLCISNLHDCWNLAAEAVRIAVTVRTPVILLTSKEMVMTIQNFDTNQLAAIKPVDKPLYQGSEPYKPYLPGANMVPDFLPLGNDRFQVRMTASTHDTKGDLQHTTKESLDNTKRLQDKMVLNLPSFTHFDYDNQESDTLIIACDVTAQAARDAAHSRQEGFPAHTKNIVSGAEGVR